VQIKLKTKDETLEYLNFELTYEKIRGLRSGVRAVRVEFQNGNWKWRVLETDKLRILDEHLRQYPNDSSRRIAKALPELGSHVTVSKLMHELDKQKKSLMNGGR
jgi:hypothetical protein